MIDSLLRAAVVTAGVAGLWLAVQTAWRKVFPECVEETGAACAGWHCRGCTKGHAEDASGRSI